MTYMDFTQASTMYKIADMQGGDSDYRWRGLEQEVGLVLVSDLAISPLILQCVFNYQLQVSCAEATLCVTVMWLTYMMCMICQASSSRPRSSGSRVARECAVICGQCGETHIGLILCSTVNSCYHPCQIACHPEAEVPTSCMVLECLS